MILSIIEMRLQLFPEYLEYRIENVICREIALSNIWWQWNHYGILMYSSPQSMPPILMNFNEWLYKNNYSNYIL